MSSEFYLNLIFRITRTKGFRKIVLYLIVFSVISSPLTLSIFADKIKSNNHAASSAPSVLPKTSAIAEKKAMVNFSPPTPVVTPSQSVGQNSKSTYDVKQFDVLKKNIQDYTKGLEGTYGMYFIDLTSGYEFGINEGDEYIAASTFKIPLNLYLFNKIKDGAIDPELRLKYLSDDYEDGTGILLNEGVGSLFKIRELSRLSLEYSDNIAANMLIRYLDKKNIKDFMREMGGQVVSDEKNISCPKDMAIYMKAVYDYCENEAPLGKELLEYFSNTKFNDRIPALLPKDIKIAHKIGSYPDAFHDIAIVYAGKPYILSIMSKNTTENAACDIIANISKKVYDFVKEM